MNIFCRCFHNHDFNGEELEWLEAVCLVWNPCSLKPPLGQEAAHGHQPKPKPGLSLVWKSGNPEFWEPGLDDLMTLSGVKKLVWATKKNASETHNKLLCLIYFLDRFGLCSEPLGQPDGLLLRLHKPSSTLAVPRGAIGSKISLGSFV